MKPIVRRVRNTFDWEYMLRFFTVVVVLYVIGNAALHADIPVAEPVPAPVDWSLE